MTPKGGIYAGTLKIPESCRVNVDFRVPLQSTKMTFLISLLLYAYRYTCRINLSTYNGKLRQPENSTYRRGPS